MYGDEYLKRSMSDPPRQISWLAVAQLLFGGVFGLLGWFFFGFGMTFFWVFAMNTDPAALFAFRGPLETAPGRVLSTEQTSYSEGGSDNSDGTPVYEYRYRFTYQERPHAGVSYRLGEPAEKPDEVTVEFPRGRPERSRIRGMRTALCAPWVLFVVIFPLVGSMFVLGRMRNGLKARYLLTCGELTQGRLVSKVATNTQINDQTVYKLTFEFETKMGHPSSIVVKTHATRVLEDDEYETILYDPTRPTYGTTLDHLPGARGLQTTEPSRCAIHALPT